MNKYKEVYAVSKIRKINLKSPKIFADVIKRKFFILHLNDKIKSDKHKFEVKTTCLGYFSKILKLE